MSWIIPPLTSTRASRRLDLVTVGFYRDNYRSLGIPLDQFRNICEAADLLIMRAVPFLDLAVGI